MQFKNKNEQPKEIPLWLKIVKGFFRFFGRALVTVLSVIIITYAGRKISPQFVKNS